MNWYQWLTTGHVITNQWLQKIHKIMIRFCSKWISNSLSFYPYSWLVFRIEHIAHLPSNGFHFKGMTHWNQFQRFYHFEQKKIRFFWCLQWDCLIEKCSYPLLRLILSDFLRILAVQLLIHGTIDAERIFFILIRLGIDLINRHHSRY